MLGSALRPPTPARPPLAAPLLHRELSSGACFAELALRAGTWNARQIELVVDERLGGPPIGLEPRKTYVGLYRGSRLQSAHAQRLQDCFPDSQILLWREHRLARVLCDPNITMDGLVRLLKDIEDPDVRNVLFSSPHMIWGSSVRQLQNWSPTVIAELSQLSSHDALLALAGRLRLAQLNGDFQFEWLAHGALWSLLARAVEFSPHLLIALDALILAVDCFFSWQPGADIRVFQDRYQNAGDRRGQAISEARLRFQEDVSIPLAVKADRSSRSAMGFLPQNFVSGGWWGAFACPVAAATGNSISPKRHFQELRLSPRSTASVNERRALLARLLNS